VKLHYLARTCLAFVLGGAVVVALAASGLTQSPTVIAQAGVLVAGVTLGATLRRPQAHRHRRNVVFLPLALGSSLLALGTVLVASGNSLAGIIADAMGATGLWLAFRADAEE
jgi:Ca2+/Na+ antiporter